MNKGTKKRSRILIPAIVLIVGVFAIAAAAFFLNGKYYPPIIMYHSIEPVPTKESLFVIPRQFEEQMKFLRDNKYNVISLDKLADMIKNGTRIPHNTVVVTFDDGDSTTFLYAFPILKKYNIPATVFMISGYIDRGGYLTAQQIRIMSEEGIDFGCHTKTHFNLKDAADGKVAEEISGSKKEVEAVIGKPVTAFCFPFGEKNVFAKEFLKKTGFKTAVLTLPSDGSVAIDRYELKRIKISTSRANLIEFRTKVSGYYTWFKVNRKKKK